MEGLVNHTMVIEEPTSYSGALAHDVTVGARLKSLQLDQAEFFLQMINARSTQGELSGLSTEQIFEHF